MKSLILLSITILICFTGNLSACDFDCTLNKHLKAIKAKDYKTFESTLTKGNRLTFILPDGTFSEDITSYKKILKEWFSAEGWTFNYKMIAVEKTDKMASALLLISYDEADRNGKPYHLDHYLSLIFKKNNGGWFLVHDQNTKTILSKE